MATPPEIIRGIYLSLLHRTSVVTNRLYPIHHMGKAGITNFAPVRLCKVKLTAGKSFSVRFSVRSIGDP